MNPDPSHHALPAKPRTPPQRPDPDAETRHLSDTGSLITAGGFRLVIEHAVMCVFGVARADLHCPNRGRASIAFARQTAMYLAHTSFSLTYAEVGTLFERDRTTVAHACEVIEDRRDDPNFDRALELLDRAVRALLSPIHAETKPEQPKASKSSPMKRDAKRSSNALPAEVSTPLSLIVKLARRNCVGEMVVSNSGTRSLRLSAGASQSKPGPNVPLVVFMQARENGWIEPVAASDGIKWRISDAGRLILRKIRSQGAGIAAMPEPAPMPEPLSRPSVDPAESPLAWLRSHRDKQGQPLISAIQFDAGERLRADLWFAQMSPRVTVNWSASGGRSANAGSGLGIDVRDNVAAAQQRVRRALEAIGPMSAGLLIDVCGHLQRLDQIEHARGWPARSAKVALQMALSELARHYGVPGAEAEAAPHASRLRHWGVTDYRPEIARDPEPSAHAADE